MADSSSADPSSSSSSLQSWILQGYIQDNFCEKASKLQQREFLRRGITKPVVGQRVEMNLIPKQHDNTCMVRLSGQVMQVLPTLSSFDPNPVLEELRDQAKDQDGTEEQALPTPLIYPKRDLQDQGGSYLLSYMMARDLRAAANDGQMDLPDDVQLVHKGPDEILCLSRKRFIKQFVFPASDAHREYHLDNQQLVMDMTGGIHGQRVLCQGRLNFDHDMCRANDEGPWRDGIPIDGRDIYQWIMVFQEGYDFPWTLEVPSMVNLGRNVQPRAWPWTLDDKLPYQRCGCHMDHPHPRVSSGYLAFHACLGLFGCESNRHPHNFAHAA